MFQRDAQWCPVSFVIPAEAGFRCDLGLCFTLGASVSPSTKWWDWSTVPMSFMPTVHTSRGLMAVVLRDLKPNRLATNLVFMWPWYVPLLLSEKVSGPEVQDKGVGRVGFSSPEASLLALQVAAFSPMSSRSGLSACLSPHLFFLKGHQSYRTREDPHDLI